MSSSFHKDASLSPRMSLLRAAAAGAAGAAGIFRAPPLAPPTAQLLRFALTNRFFTCPPARADNAAVSPPREAAELAFFFFFSSSFFSSSSRFFCASPGFSGKWSRMLSGLISE